MAEKSRSDSSSGDMDVEAMIRKMQEENGANAKVIAQQEYEKVKREAAAFRKEHREIGRRAYQRRRNT